MSWAHCGGRLEIIASIEERQIIAKILSHLKRAVADQGAGRGPIVPLVTRWICATVAGSFGPDGPFEIPIRIGALYQDRPRTADR